MSYIVIDSKEKMDYYAAIHLKAGLKLWRDAGIKPNKAWTPTAMMKRAEQITGQKFKARDYTGAIEALVHFCDEKRGSYFE